MRDDIHKRVPRPHWVQNWVKRAVNNADRLSGRSLDALNDSIRTTCQKEISETFRQGLVAALNSPPGLFGTLGDVSTPRDLGSRGGHLEAEVLSETKRLLARGHSLTTVAEAAVTSVLEARVQSDIRAVAPVLLGTRDRKAWLVVNHMQADAETADCAAHARAFMGSVERPAYRISRAPLSMDEDMRGLAGSGGR